VLAAMTATQIYLGPSGSGATIKLAYNAMIALANEAIAEALVLTERAGITPPTPTRARRGRSLLSIPQLQAGRVP
jgi:3-hydroxyisobutyrate dehydrogenase-like beta-hydroxyacid dehydrogenase